METAACGDVPIGTSDSRCGPDRPIATVFNLERLRVLHTVWTTGSVGGAAAALHVTTSAVSQQIAPLEREIGQQLLERQGRPDHARAAERRTPVSAGPGAIRRDRGGPRRLRSPPWERRDWWPRRRARD